MVRSSTRPQLACVPPKSMANAFNATPIRSSARERCSIRRDHVLLSLMAKVHQSRFGIKISQLRLCLDSVKQRQVSAENRIDHQICEASSCNAAPVINVRRIIGAFVSGAVLQRKYTLDKMCLPDRPLISRLRQILDPSRNAGRWIGFVQSLGSRRRPSRVCAQPTVVWPDIPGGVHVVGRKRPHPVIAMEFLPEKPAHLLLLRVAEVLKHVVEHREKIVAMAYFYEGAVGLATFPPAFSRNIEFFIDSPRQFFGLDAQLRSPRGI